MRAWKEWMLRVAGLERRLKSKRVSLTRLDDNTRSLCFTISCGIILPFRATLKIETWRRGWSRLIPEGSHHRLQSNYTRSDYGITRLKPSGELDGDKVNGCKIGKGRNVVGRGDDANSGIAYFFTDVQNK